MRRTLLSAVLAGALLAAALAVLVLFLNPEARVRSEWLALLRVLALYTPLAALALLAASGLLTLARFWPAGARAPLPALPWYSALLALASGAATAVYWLNLLSYRQALPRASVSALFAASLVLTLATLLLIALLLDAYLFPFRSRRIPALLVGVATTLVGFAPASLRPTLPPAARPVPFEVEPVQPVRRIVLIGVDGLGAQAVSEGIARGTLPSFARLVRRGAFGALATIRPTEGPPVWTTIFTGHLPRDHGVKSLVTYRLAGSNATWELMPKGIAVGLLERLGWATRWPVTPGSRRRRALWEELNAFGIGTGVVRFWGTSPAEHVRGFMLGHSFHLRVHDARAAELLHPPDLLAEVRARALAPEQLDEALLGEFVDFSVQVPNDRVAWRRELAERALAPDMTYERAAGVLRAAYDPPFFALSFYGLDPVGHSFLRFAQPEHFGDVSAAEQRRYGKVLERYLAYVSQSVGEQAQALRPDDILVVVSGYGMHPTPLWRRLVGAALGQNTPGGTHADAPDGFLLMVGDGVRGGASLGRASVLDVTPTLLYLMGLPVARDMPGRVLAEALDDRFVRAHPLSVVPSYESLAVTAAPKDMDPSDPLLLPDEELP